MVERGAWCIIQKRVLTIYAEMPRLLQWFPPRHKTYKKSPNLDSLMFCLEIPSCQSSQQLLAWMNYATVTLRYMTLAFISLHLYTCGVLSN